MFGSIWLVGEAIILANIDYTKYAQYAQHVTNHLNAINPTVPCHHSDCSAGGVIIPPVPNCDQGLEGTVAWCQEQCMKDYKDNTAWCKEHAPNHEYTIAVYVSPARETDDKGAFAGVERKSVSEPCVPVDVRFWLDDGIRLLEFMGDVAQALNLALQTRYSLPVDQLPKAILDWIEEHPGQTAFMIIGAVAFFASTIIEVPILYSLGFTAEGVREGSAAAIQSYIGNVEAGSLFALSQSAGMGGAGQALIHSWMRMGCATMLAFAAINAITRSKPTESQHNIKDCSAWCCPSGPCGGCCCCQRLMASSNGTSLSRDIIVEG